MKRIITLVALLLISTPAFADNSARIKELEGQLKTFAQQYQQLEDQQKKIQSQADMTIGAIQELKKQDAPADTPKTEVKVEDKKK